VREGYAFATDVGGVAGVIEEGDAEAGFWFGRRTVSTGVAIAAFSFTARSVL
jgi:hypothetical protein